MPRFHKLLEQEYLKLDIKPEELSEIQKNLVDKMVSSEKAKYEIIKIAKDIEFNMIKGRREITHFDIFIININQILKSY